MLIRVHVRKHTQGEDHFKLGALGFSEALQQLERLPALLASVSTPETPPPPHRKKDSHYVRADLLTLGVVEGRAGSDSQLKSAREAQTV